MTDSNRVARKISSWPITRWVVGTFPAVKWHKAHKAPEIHERMRAFRAAAPNTQERLYAHFDYQMAVLNELAKSKWVKVDAPPPEVTEPELRNIWPLLHKIETGTATENDIEEFQPLAREILQNWQPQYSPEFKNRIEPH